MNGYMTAKEAADKWNLSVRNVQNMCGAGKLAGAVKFGNSWAIPEEVERPKDKRIVTGAYKNWRKKANTEKSNE